VPQYYGKKLIAVLDLERIYVCTGFKDITLFYVEQQPNRNRLTAIASASFDAARHERPERQLASFEPFARNIADIRVMPDPRSRSTTLWEPLIWIKVRSPGSP
jgi:hypothetical protein